MDAAGEKVGCIPLSLAEAENSLPEASVGEAGMNSSLCESSSEWGWHSERSADNADLDPILGGTDIGQSSTKESVLVFGEAPRGLTASLVHVAVAVERCSMEVLTSICSSAIAPTMGVGMSATSDVLEAVASCCSGLLWGEARCREFSGDCNGGSWD